MTPTIKTIPEKFFIGKSLTTSIADNKTFELFSSFMPRKKEILNTVTTDIFDLKIYPVSYFSAFNPTTPFTKWVLVEVSNFKDVPNGMDTFTLEGGLYTVFHYKGLNTDHSIFEYIFGTWIPNSDYVIDNRPHFDVLGEKHKNNDPNSEEEIWIPIKLK